MLKQELLQAISAMPENISIEDIMYHLYILDKHNKALQDIDQNRLYSTEQVRQGIGKS